MLNIEDFRTWMQNPCTQLFCQWLEKNRKELYDDSTANIARNFHKKEIEEDARAKLGIVAGLDTTIYQIEGIKEAIKNNEEKIPDDFVDNMIAYVKEEYESSL